MLKIDSIIVKSNNGKLFYIFESEHERMLDIVNEYTSGIYVLLSCDNWDDEYSPWQASNPMGGVFHGKGKETLDTFNSYRKEIKNKYPEILHEYIIGYSLAGLFALYTFYELELDGVGACSASLWFNQFDEYIKAHAINRACRIYLSVGGKEEKSKNPVMATIGDRYRVLSRSYKSNPIIQTTLVMNPGGHFGKSALRMKQAIDWLAGK